SGIADLIALRNAARTARNFAEADRIRAELRAAGIEVEDEGDRSRWRAVPVP
ncbi:MAG: cysteine--tRNA ligase, partial [Thermoplasmata archaeon]|nr:cysteine--tRNA ligase [Thermoplasmata archaeon]